MKSLVNSFFSAIVGGLVVFALFNFTQAPQTKVVKEVLSRSTGSPDSTAAKGSRLTAEEIYERYSDSVVHVKAVVSSTFEDFFGLPQPENQISSGSGFIVSKQGYVITNAHVVGEADKIIVQLSDKTEVPAKLVGVDRSSDLAFLKVDISGHKYKVLSLGDSRRLKVGQAVYAIGNPLGYDRSMSGGIVSALNREIQAPNNFPIRGVIQTDAAINRGNSGGPLLSSNGKVIGVTSQIASTGQGNIGIAFAIPSATVQKIFEEILESGKASHPWIGIQGATLFPDVAKELRLNVTKGVMVVQVVKSGPAEKAGLKGATGRLSLGEEEYEIGGDVIIKLSRSTISSMDDLIAEISKYKVGQEIDLTVIRDDNEQVVKVKLDERPQN